jgi:hypothetical protein
MEIGFWAWRWRLHWVGPMDRLLSSYEYQHCIICLLRLVDDALRWIGSVSSEVITLPTDQPASTIKQSAERVLISNAEQIGQNSRTRTWFGSGGSALRRVSHFSVSLPRLTTLIAWPCLVSRRSSLWNIILHQCLPKPRRQWKPKRPCLM